MLKMCLLLGYFETQKVFETCIGWYLLGKICHQHIK
jgi:hypothetical protein